jgi:hypothetical protein
MADDPHDCRLNAKRCLELAGSAATPEDRQAWLALAETWKQLAAEMDSEEALLQTLAEMDLVREPWNALPEALHLSFAA